MLERFSFAAFRFASLALGDVAENENDAADLVLVVANRRRDLFDYAFAAIFGRESNGLGKSYQN